MGAARAQHLSDVEIEVDAEWLNTYYSENNLGEISDDYTWLTMVLETLSEAKEVLKNTDTEKMHSTALNGYRLFSTEVEYGGVKQRRVVVFSEKAFARETKTLEREIEKDIWHFANWHLWNIKVRNEG